MKKILSSCKSHRPLLPFWSLLATMTPMTSSAMDNFQPEEKAYYLCAGCHGPGTGSVLYPMPHDIPTIIGQKKEYLLKQLIAYREGNREHPNMNNVLGNYTDQNLADLAEYYQNLGPKRPERKALANVVAPAAVAPPAITHPTHAHHHHKRKATKTKVSTSPSSNTKTP